MMNRMPSLSCLAILLLTTVVASATAAPQQWVPQSQLAKTMADYTAAIKAMENNKDRPEAVLDTLPSDQVLGMIDRDETVWLRVVKSRNDAITALHDQHRRFLDMVRKIAKDPTGFDNKQAERDLRDQEDSLIDAEDDIDTRLDKLRQQPGADAFVLTEQLTKERVAIAAIRKKTQEARRLVQSSMPSSSPDRLQELLDRAEADEKQFQSMIDQSAAEEQQVQDYHNTLRDRVRKYPAQKGSTPVTPLKSPPVKPDAEPSTTTRNP